MALEAVLITDRRIAEPPWLRREWKGWTGQRNYWVNTHLEEKAVQVVPQLGDSWSSGLPDLFVMDQATRYYAKKDDPSTGPPTYGGYTVVTNNYATVGMAGHLPPPLVSTRFTEIGYQSETVTAKYDVDFLAHPKPIANGEGTGLLVGVVTARVYMYLALNVAPDWARLWRLTREKFLNDAEITLPPVPGTVNPIPVPKGQARYEGFSTQVKNQVLEVAHDLVLAGDAGGFGDPFDVIWQEENKEGKAVSTQASTIYGSASFAGLW